MTMRSALLKCIPGFGWRGRRARPNGTRDAGFTILELMVVMGIMSMLAAVSYPIVSNRMQQGRISAAKLQISGIMTALEMYMLDNGNYPPQQVGLAALLQQPANASRPPYLKGGLTDPWGSPYNYKLQGSKNGPEVFVTASEKNPAISSDLLSN
jgi:general secretion pathway protein G